MLVGHRTSDDAAVYRLDETTAIVQTVDYFTPIVDDPYDFGRVAAANSLSDVYAMGARPIFALAVIGFPATKLPIELMGEILRGGAEKAREAGIDVVGGHSIDDAEPKYGLVVTGLVDPAKMTTNTGGRAGDALVLTKPLGTGILTTAFKREALSDERLTAVVEGMAALNDRAARAMVACGVRGATDVTGYGLLGHLTELARGSGVSARIEVAALPLLEGTRELVEAGHCPGGTKRNLAYFGADVEWGEDVGETDRLIAADAQTSGGLLIAIAPDRLDDLLAALEAEGVETRAVIGALGDGEAGAIEVA